MVYTALMLSYSKWLKKIILIDVMVIALGFVLRVAAGVMVIKVNYFSPWLFVLTTLLALYLGFGKRLWESSCWKIRLANTARCCTDTSAVAQ